MLAWLIADTVNVSWGGGLSGMESVPVRRRRLPVRHKDLPATLTFTWFFLGMEQVLLVSKMRTNAAIFITYRVVIWILPLNDRRPMMGAKTSDR